ncbi:MAG: beta-ketoacyl-[acyl-carrier-protein] synthase family protein [Desulfobacterales bacterium]|nr:beta-ketoacyl-[acyl-carrier-protein] synthase family protein [Desulfobacterales bacterium]
MKSPKNRRVYVIDYDVVSPLGDSFEKTWKRAVNCETGFRKVTRCNVDTLSYIVGEIPDWNPSQLPFIEKKELSHWDASYVFLTMLVCKQALERSGIFLDEKIAPKTACLIGSALNGTDSYRIAMNNLLHHGPTKVSPYLLPNLCANLPSGKAGMLLGFTGPIFSPQGACASGNYAMGIGARMIRDGDCDIVLAGGVDTCLIPEIILGFENMSVTFKVHPNDRAFTDPNQASRPFSIDRKGIILSEGAGVVVLAADDIVSAYGLKPKAEIAGVGWSSDAYHFIRPKKETIVCAIQQAIEDASLEPKDIQYINAHGTSTAKGDKTEIESLRMVFDNHLSRIPISSNKSQFGHTLGASAAIEAALSIEAMRQGILLPTLNYIPDPEFIDLDLVPNTIRNYSYECFLSNAFGFGGTNCCIVFKGV